MRLKLFIFLTVLCLTNSFSQNFGSFASGIKINNTIYNVTASGVNNQINPSPSSQSFDGLNLGSFGQNSTCALITGGEIKTFKEVNANVCSAVLNWRVYPVGNASGMFNAINLTTVADCNLATNTFNDGLGPCTIRDQKWILT